MIDRMDELPAPIEYLRELIAFGFVVRMRGRGGKLVYSEGFRRVRFGWETAPKGAIVYASSARYWELGPSRLPIWPLSRDAKIKVLARVGQYLANSDLQLIIQG